MDDTFGAERDIDFEDGGFIVIAQAREDLDCFARDHVVLDSPTLEYVEPVSSTKELYLNAFSSSTSTLRESACSSPHLLLRKPC